MYRARLSLPLPDPLVGGAATRSFQAWHLSCQQRPPPAWLTGLISLTSSLVPQGLPWPQRHGRRHCRRSWWALHGQHEVKGVLQTPPSPATSSSSRDLPACWGPHSHKALKRQARRSKVYRAGSRGDHTRSSCWRQGGRSIQEEARQVGHGGAIVPLDPQCLAQGSPPGITVPPCAALGTYSHVPLTSHLPAGPTKGLPADHWSCRSDPWSPTRDSGPAWDTRTHRHSFTVQLPDLTPSHGTAPLSRCLSQPRC